MFRRALFLLPLNLSYLCSFSQRLRRSTSLLASSLALSLLNCYEVWVRLNNYCRVTTSSDVRHYFVALVAIPLIACRPEPSQGFGLAFNSARYSARF